MIMTADEFEKWLCAEANLTLALSMISAICKVYNLPDLKGCAERIETAINIINEHIAEEKALAYEGLSKLEEEYQNE